MMPVTCSCILCPKGKGQGRQRKHPTDSQGQNSSAMDTPRKVLHTWGLIQVGGMVYLWKSVRTYTLQDRFSCSIVKDLSRHTCSVIISTIYTKGPTHRLEITPPLPEPDTEHSHSTLRLADLASEDEERMHGRISQYETKIDSLLTEVSSLKNEVNVERIPKYYMLLVSVKKECGKISEKSTQICVRSHQLAHLPACR